MGISKMCSIYVKNPHILSLIVLYNDMKKIGPCLIIEKVFSEKKINKKNVFVILILILLPRHFKIGFFFCDLNEITLCFMYMIYVCYS